MTTCPKVTVIMSVRNAESYLRVAIESILDQSYKDFYFFVTDDGSEDETLNILKYYCEKNQNMRLFVNDKPLGLPKSLNAMAEVAETIYLARMDGDDFADPVRFERQLKVLESEPEVDACFTEINFMNEEGRVICRRKSPKSTSKIIKLLPHINYFAHPTAMLRASSLKKIGGYNERFLSGQDWELWQRMLSADMRFRTIPEALLNYRVHPKNNSGMLSRSSCKSEYFFEAALLMQNGSKLRALKLIPRLNIGELPEVFIRFFLPRYLYIILIKLRSKYSSNSPVKKLMSQDVADS